MSVKTLSRRDAVKRVVAYFGLMPVPAGGVARLAKANPGGRQSWCTSYGWPVGPTLKTKPRPDVPGGFRSGHEIAGRHPERRSFG